MISHRQSPRILICPLDWGLGHAVRCVPIIRALIDNGCVPIIAADHGPLTLLQKEFPNIECVKFPGVTVTYPENGSMIWNMLKQSPALLKGIKDETLFIEKIVDQLKIDAIISDNRFGAFSKVVPSIYITHQIHIQTGNVLTDFIVRKQHAAYMKNFTSVWIPDIASENNLSGKLSHGKYIPTQAHYIGSLSRFSTIEEKEKIYDVSFILSGPEPQRTLLENIILEQASEFPDKKLMLVRGKNEPLKTSLKNTTCISLADGKTIQSIYSNSEKIVCRSGYTSIMEMFSVGRSAVLIPTPAQTEQEYLANYLHGKFGFTCTKQHLFSLQNILQSQSFISHRSNPENGTLMNCIKELLDLIQTKKAHS